VSAASARDAARRCGVAVGDARVLGEAEAAAKRSGASWGQCWAWVRVVMYVEEGRP
jgi:hypothetical protein